MRRAVLKMEHIPDEVLRVRHEDRTARPRRTTPRRCTVSPAAWVTAGVVVYVAGCLAVVIALLRAGRRR